MKKIIMILFIVVAALAFSMQAHAALYNRGVDSLGNQLFYDDDLNITWYDYISAADTWQNQMDWADGLTVNFGGIVFDDWRLPITVDGPYSNGWDCTGTATAGYNVTTSELGHLFYVESNNPGFVDTSCNETDAWIFIGGASMGEFANQQQGIYWSSTEYATNPSEAWSFFYDNSSGRQATRDKTNSYLGIAVRPGDVAVVPEPISSTLFIIGAGLLAGRRYLRRGK